MKDPVDHRTLYQARFEPQVLLEAVAVVDRCGYDPLLCADTFAEGFDFYHASRETRTPELAHYLGAQSRPRPALAGAARGAAAGRFRRFRRSARRSRCRSWRRCCNGELPGKLHTHVLRPPRYAGFFTEIAPAGVTKWSAIQRLARQWGIAEAEICAVGDDVNDIPMMRAAGLGVAMGNALPSVKAAADRIAPSHDEDGLAEVVAWLLEEGIRGQGPGVREIGIGD